MTREHTHRQPVPPPPNLAHALGPGISGPKALSLFLGHTRVHLPRTTEGEQGAAECGPSLVCGALPAQRRPRMGERGVVWGQGHGPGRLSCAVRPFLTLPFKGWRILTLSLVFWVIGKSICQGQNVSHQSFAVWASVRTPALGLQKSGGLVFTQ